MELKATLEFVKVVEARSGVSKAGKQWKVVTALFRDVNDIDKTYPPDYVLSGLNDLGDRIESLPYGEVIDVVFAPECREYNGKYYTSLKLLYFSLNKPKQEEKEEKVIEFYDQEYERPKPQNAPPVKSETDLPF